MYTYDKNSNLIFTNKKNEKYLWTKKNYEAHSLKREIKSKESLDNIDKTINNPDCITKGLEENQKNFYCVTNYQKSKKSISVLTWKVICFRKSKKFYIIATVIFY